MNLLDLIKKIKEVTEEIEIVNASKIYILLNKEIELEYIETAFKIMQYYGDFEADGTNKNFANYMLKIYMHGKNIELYEMPIPEIKMFYKWYKSPDLANKISHFTVCNYIIPKEKILLIEIVDRNGNIVNINEVLNV